MTSKSAISAISAISAASRLVHLDALRGVAAIVVVVGHIRAFLLVDYAEVAGRDVINMGVYFVGSLGHAAVLAFFALSGFLVGGSALVSMLEARWSGTRYIITRISRLWTVALPAIALTWIVDMIGMGIAGPAGYSGGYWSSLSSGPSPDAPASWSVHTVIGNTLFLQTIAVPVIGTNGPLWSLANEFWYYTLFLLGALALCVRGALWLRVTAFISAFALAAVLPSPLIILGTIWLAGALTRVAMRSKQFSNLIVRLDYQLGVVVAVSLSLVAGARGVSGVSSLMGDLLQGMSWAMAVPVLAVRPGPRGRLGTWYRLIATGLSEISYSLYAVHFPVLAAIYFSFLAPKQWSPGLIAFCIGIELLIISLIAAVGSWWLFERNTHIVKNALLRLFNLDCGREVER